MGIPGVKRAGFWDRDWVAEMFSSGPPVLAACIGAFLNWSDPQKSWSVPWLVLGALWLSVATVLKVRRARKKEKAQDLIDSPSDIFVCVSVLYYQLKRHCKIADGPDGLRRLRITMHRIVPPPPDEAEAKEFEQVTPYAGGAGGEPGRAFPINCGVIGLAARDNEPYTFKWDGKDPTKLVNELVTVWHFTPAEAGKMVKDRRSWMAVPIADKTAKVIGVVYLDSCDEKFFTQKVQNLIVSSCYDVADFIGERYG